VGKEGGARKSRDLGNDRKFAGAHPLKGDQTGGEHGELKTERIRGMREVEDIGSPRIHSFQAELLKEVGKGRNGKKRVRGF